ncbi:MAG TPA: hypothetical protein VG244_04885 [Acidimicrobiales bacterium]|nr:hypothetical protein [Acidimicrobiales bacterium]
MGCQRLVLSDVPLNSSSNEQFQVPLSPSGVVPEQPEGAGGVVVVVVLVVVVVVVLVVVVVVGGVYLNRAIEAAARLVDVPNGASTSTVVTTAAAVPAKSAATLLARHVSNDIVRSPSIRSIATGSGGVRGHGTGGHATYLGPFGLLRPKLGLKDYAVV